MGQSLTFTIKFNVDPPNVQQALNAVNSSLQNVGVSVTNVAEDSKKLNTLDDGFVKLGLRVQGFLNLFSVVSSTFGGLIASSNEGERSSAKLTQALENQGVFSEELLADLQAYAAQRQQLTGIDDDATVGIMSQLVAMGLQGQSLKDAIVSVQDLSTLMDGDMQGAVRVVADAFEGNSSMLKRYIKGLDEADIKQRGVTSIIEQMTKAVGGQAEAIGNTGAGALAKFDANLDDLKQAMGDILKNILAPFVSVLSQAVKLIIDGGPAAHIAALGVTGLGVAFTFLGTSMGGLPFIIGGILTGVISLLQLFGDASDETDETGRAAQAAALEIDSLSASIRKLKTEAGHSAEIDELQKKIDKLRNPETERSLVSALDAAKKKAEEYQQKLADGEVVLQKVLALERQGKDVREADAELAQQYFEIFSDGTKTNEVQLKDLAAQQTRATKEMKEAEAALLQFRKQKTGEEQSLDQKRQDAAFEIERKRIGLMQDGTAKRFALANLEYREEAAQLLKRLKAREITEEQYTALLAVEKKKRDAILNRDAEKAQDTAKAKEKAAAGSATAMEKDMAATVARNSAMIKTNNQLKEAEEQKSEAERMATEQSILAGAQEYDASVNLGIQLNKQVNQSIRRIIAEAVATQIAKVIAFIPFPFNLVAAPAAGIAVQALIEKLIPKFGGGGDVSGTSGVDRILAMLTDGEFVIRREMAQPNLKFLRAFNAGNISVPRFAQGGVVGGLGTIDSPAGGVGELKKELVAMKRILKNLKLQVNIAARTDISKFDKEEKKLQRARAAYAL